MVILPGMIAHFDISRDRSIRAIEQCMMDSLEDFPVGAEGCRTGRTGADDVYHIGVIAEVKQVIKLQNNIVRILVEGIERAELSAFAQTDPYLLAEVAPCVLPGGGAFGRGQSRDGAQCTGDIQPVSDGKSACRKRIAAPDRYYTGSAGARWIRLRTICRFLTKKKQKILEAMTLTERYEVLMALLLKEIEITAIQNEFQSKVKERVDKNQKEYILREQMKAHPGGTGEDNTESDADEYQKALDALDADQEVKTASRRRLTASRASARIIGERGDPRLYRDAAGASVE